jgi:hypothetical protein
MEWVFFIVIPCIILLLGFIALSRYKNPKIDTPINFGQYWFRLLGSSITLRQIIRFFILIFPFIYLVLFNILPGYFFWLIIFLPLIFFFLKYKPRSDEQSQEVLDALTEMSSKLTESRLHLEHLANLVKAKQLEVDEKERIQRELEYQINKKAHESKELEKLTESQKELILKVIRKSQRPSVLDSTGIILGSIALNIFATLIWTLLGNPGKDAIVNQLKTFGQIFTK